MAFLGMLAADEGVQRIDAMHQSIFLQKFQRPVNRGRRQPPAGLHRRQPLQNRIGAQRLVALPHQLQHLFAQRGEALTALLAELPRRIESGRHAAAVVVLAKRKIGSRCFHGRLARSR